MARAKRQLQIKGTERNEIKEVNTAAEAYIEARDERMKLTKSEVEARETLAAVMKKHGLDVYKDEDVTPPLIVTLIPGDDQVKVTRAKENEEEADAA